MDVRRSVAWVCLASAVLAGPVLAADDHGEADVSLFGDFSFFGQALWTLVIFVLVLVVLGKFAWGPLLKVLQNREAFIRDSLASAKKDRDEAEARLTEYKEQLANARAEASAIVEEGRRDAEVTARGVLDEGRKAARAEQDRAVREIQIARDTALKDLYEQSAQLATDMAGSVLKREVSVADHERLITDTLSQLRDRQTPTLP